MTEEKQMTWEKAVLKVLRDANEALHPQQIYRKIADEKMVKTRAKNPSDTVWTTCTNLVRKQKIRRVEPGIFQINQDPAEATKEEIQGAIEDAKQAEKYPSRAYGLLWSRDKVNWKGLSKKNKWGEGLLGQDSEGTQPRNFSTEPGIYLLHQHGRVMYVGQAKVALYERLLMHTKDDLSDRWDEFSWFALGEVGKVNHSDLPMSDMSAEKGVIIDLLEAVLIEAILPPLNKKRGNNLGTQYMQYRS